MRKPTVSEILVILFLLAAALSGCGSGPATPTAIPAPTATPVSAEELTILRQKAAELDRINGVPNDLRWAVGVQVSYYDHQKVMVRNYLTVSYQEAFPDITLENLNGERIAFIKRGFKSQAEARNATRKQLNDMFNKVVESKFQGVWAQYDVVQFNLEGHFQAFLPRDANFGRAIPDPGSIKLEEDMLGKDGWAVLLRQWDDGATRHMDFQYRSYERVNLEAFKLSMKSAGLEVKETEISQEEALPHANTAAANAVDLYRAEKAWEDIPSTITTISVSVMSVPYGDIDRATRKVTSP